MMDGEKKKKVRSRRLISSTALVILIALGILSSEGIIGKLPFDFPFDLPFELPFELPFDLTGKSDEPVVEIDQLIGMDIPEWGDSPYITVGDNMPEDFDKKDLNIQVHYSDLDELGRCGAAWGVLDGSLMPEVEREENLETKPSGWAPAVYEDLIEDGFLYNRCHLIGYQLTGENDNLFNLITGTRYFNIEGMLPFENRVASYIRREDGKVFYRVTPLFRGDEAVARFVRMEAYSLEDHGVGVSFDVLIYNVQPGIEIDYATGESKRVAED